MNQEELKKSINFRRADFPCCGNCKWFSREWEYTKCHHPENVWKYSEQEMSEIDNALTYNNEINVCSRFEAKVMVEVKK